MHWRCHCGTYNTPTAFTCSFCIRVEPSWHCHCGAYDDCIDCVCAGFVRGFPLPLPRSEHHTPATSSEKKSIEKRLATSSETGKTPTEKKPIEKKKPLNGGRGEVTMGNEKDESVGAGGKVKGGCVLQ